MRPQSIVRFEQAYLASVLLWLVHLVLGWNTQMSVIERYPGVRGNPQMVDFIQNGLFVTYAIALALWLLLAYFAGRRASNAAKWALVVFVGLSALSLLAILPNLGQVSGLSLALSLATFAANAYAVFLLFRPDAKAWFEGTPTAEAQVETFD